ncbi:MAG: hypothetical protein KKD25_05460 [Gammaproteobacteria bacterium]|nr:hypothetical protein [Gammaproteobacteria bacterium]MBU0771490.1 hypothetical protein [Gammaproteobacteria bacterium]MBU0857436.1 hypothetical protein [Gammaproteobacteria bacterium]MBU1846583.1 hypothetical protein [Gammaproteobacteria bacterium]
MKFHRLYVMTATIAALVAPGLAAANDFPTASRVEFALDCIQNYSNNQEYIYKCSCLIDEIAAKLSYDEYVELSSFSRSAAMSGERGGMFRGTDQTKEAVKKYLGIVSESKKRCFIK